METTVNKTIIDEFVIENGPNGLEKLALKSGVSTRTICHARAGRAPKREVTKRLLAKALKVTVEALFPKSVSADEGKAS